MNQASLYFQVIIVLLLVAMPCIALSGAVARSGSAPIQATATVIHPVGLEEFPPESDQSHPALLFRSPGSAGTYVEIEADGVCIDCPYRSKLTISSQDAITGTDDLLLMSYDDLIQSVPTGTHECTVTVFVTEN